MVQMSPVEAHRRLVKLGILMSDQIECLRCGSKHYPERAQEVLKLAAIVLPTRFPYHAGVQAS